MNSSVPLDDERRFSRNMMTSFIQIAALVILVGYCALIVAPFASIVIWALVLAVAIFPLHRKLADTLGGKASWSAAIITLLGLAIIVVPGWLIADSTIETARSVQQAISNDALEVPTPRENVRGWPLVGEQAYEIWTSASRNLQETLAEYSTQVRAAGRWSLDAALGVMTGVLHFIASVILAGFFLMYPRKGYDTTAAIAERIAPDKGEQLTDLMIATIRSVTNGVLGVAVIQAALAGIGFALIGLPAAGVFTVVILVAAIVQLPALLIMIPLITWVFSFASTGAAVAFAIYAVIVALSDNVLKPLLLGRGVDLPVLVILIGAIGGMLRFGVIGLFLGAVILGLGYQIITVWIRSNSLDSGTVAPGEAGPSGS